MELFYAEGPEIVREIKRRGHRIFLDLKLHDIPNTVKKAMAVLSRLDVDMCNVHAAGTIEMMRAAIEGLTCPDGTRLPLIAVTQLYFDFGGAYAARAAHFGADQRYDRQVCAEHPRTGFGRRGLLSAGGRYGERRPVGGKFTTVTPGAFCGRRGGRSVQVTTPARARGDRSTISWWGVPSRRQPIPWRPIAGAWRSS